MGSNKKTERKGKRKMGKIDRIAKKIDNALGMALKRLFFFWW